MSKLIRLYPRNPQLGFVLRSYTILDPPLRFLVHRGWYQVDDEVADLLVDVPQQERFSTGPKAFMIAEDQAAAKKMDAKVASMVLKAKKLETVGTADAPVPTTRPGAKKKRATEAVSDEEEGKPKTRKKKAAAG